MTVWAIADLHLSLGVPGKNMDKFGPHWTAHSDKIAANWRACVAPDDLVLIAGDVSWALRLPDAMADLQWLAALPGDKLLIRGNHDHWWPKSATKLASVLPPSLHVLHRSAFHWHDVTVAGSRLWDIPGVTFDEILANPSLGQSPIIPESKPGPDGQKILTREIERLRASLEQMPPNARYRICMTHYPPLPADLRDTGITTLIESFGVNTVVFGHLHNVRTDMPIFGTKNGTQYLLTSCDYLDFKPVRIVD